MCVFFSSFDGSAWFSSVRSPLSCSRSYFLAQGTNIWAERSQLLLGDVQWKYFDVCFFFAFPYSYFPCPIPATTRDWTRVQRTARGCATGRATAYLRRTTGADWGTDIGPVYTGPNQSWIQSYSGLASSTYYRLINGRPVSEDSRQRIIVQQRRNLDCIE